MSTSATLKLALELAAKVTILAHLPLSEMTDYWVVSVWEWAKWLCSIPGWTVLKGGDYMTDKPIESELEGEPNHFS